MFKNMGRGAGIVPIYFGNDGVKILVVRGISGKWSLPKGSQENGEKYEQTAIREMREETGIHVSLDQLKSPFHVGDYKLWFVEFSDMVDVKIQESELTDYEWMDFQDLIRLDKDTTNYSVKGLVSRFRDKRWPVYGFIAKRQTVLEPLP